MINAYCVDEITIFASNGNDSWGEPLSGTAVTVRGYVEYKTRLIRNIRGEEVVSTVMVRLPLSIERSTFLGRPLSHEDRLWIEGESFDRAIIDVRRPKHWTDPHYEVYLA